MPVLLWLGKVGVRVALVVGAVKVSLDNDVWSLRTNTGSETYQKLKQYVLPGIIIYKKKLPSVEEVQVSVGSKWNQNINCAFSCIAELPSIMRKKLSEVSLSVPKLSA